MDTSDWLGSRDSNPDKQSQSLLSCRWTTPQHGVESCLRAPLLTANASVNCKAAHRITALAGEQGFEPRYYGPEPHVLPLDDSPADLRISSDFLTMTRPKRGEVTVARRRRQGDGFNEPVISRASRRAMRANDPSRPIAVRTSKIPGLTAIPSTATRVG